jgi:L-ascorbate metabolism protein UlaG (beta-lactamase superfamily)
MEITKIGHCCLLIRDQGKTILTDPGVFSDGQNQITGIDIILITHEHQDHLHMDSVKQVLKNNPHAVAVTNTSVGKLLDMERIPYRILEDGQSDKFGELLIEGFGSKHAVIHKSIPIIQNTGYVIAGKLCYPGDAFEKPKTWCEIIALPVAGPWLKISDSIDYALELKPKFVFPVHDGSLKTGGFAYSVTDKVIKPYGIKFIEPAKDQPLEF